MGPIEKIADKFSGLVDIIMPLNDDYEEDLDEVEDELAETKKKKSAVNSNRRNSVAEASYTEEYKVSNGESIRVERPALGHEAGAFRQKKSQPQLTVHTTKQPQLKMQIYAPRNFDQVTAIADDLKDGKACVVNYEQIEVAEQRRICDFVNGVCYVLDGSARRVSNQIMLYVPNGVDVAEAMTMALTD
ncbi:MAG: cell division protein SepF [Selenomonas sp.]|uniref:cell division protein SepF n=1 Tax=Selenomonas sp. TaxID=2053611 RepID=UPI0025D0AA96|nr:cell division protein SepF [Selenomonas sp.]MCR5757607.1 cell division protein SepF [Selenomonas sp.]